MKSVISTILIATVSFIGTGLVQAEDLVASWSIKDGPPMTLELQDQDNFRMNMGEDSYILMSKGKGYMVSKEDGEWVATSMESMKKMMEMSGIRDMITRMGKKNNQDNRPPQFKKTGRVETIAGITGQVYLVSMEDPSGKQETVEMVFGEDPRLIRLHQAQARWAESLGMMGGQGGSSYSELIKKYAKNGPGGAMLRYADVMKLESIQEAKLNNSRFRVPRVREIDMVPLQDIHEQSKKRIRRPRPSVPTVLEEEKERLPRRTEKRGAENSEPENVHDDVMKGVNSFLKGLFGD